MALIDIVVANPLTMNTRIVVSYNMPDDEFEQLSNAYPLGKYKGTGKNPKWFTLETDFYDGDHNVCGTLELTWFKTW